MRWGIKNVNLPRREKGGKQGEKVWIGLLSNEISHGRGQGANFFGPFSSPPVPNSGQLIRLSAKEGEEN